MRKKHLQPLFFGAVLLVLGFLVSSIREQLFAQPLPGMNNPADAGAVIQIPPTPPRWLVDFADFIDQRGIAYRKITIVDPETRWIGVYSVRLNDGEVQLQSTRSISSEMQLRAFNATDPLPEKIEMELRRARQTPQ